jgi:phosphoglycerate dehydrogenase-like enzyme
VAFKMVMLPPQSDVARQWTERLRADVPDMELVVAEGVQQAQHAIVDADGAYGVLPADLLKRAQKLRWLQSPQAAPPAGYYYEELVAHPLVVTNMREIFNDCIGAHIMAYVYAFARGLHY